MSDEIIAEVRSIKDALAAQHNYNLRALFEIIKRGEAELKAGGVRIIPPPSPTDGKPSTALQRNRFARRRG